MNCRFWGDTLFWHRNWVWSKRGGHPDVGLKICVEKDVAWQERILAYKRRHIFCVVPLYIHSAKKTSGPIFGHGVQLTLISDWRVFPEIFNPKVVDD